MIDLNNVFTNDMRMNLAGQYADKGDAKTAIALYGSIPVEDNNGPAALCNLASIYMREKQLAVALETIQGAIWRDPKSAHAHQVKAQIQMELAAYANADEEFREALRLDPDYIPALINYGYLQCLVGDFGHALGLFNRVFDLNPHDVRARFNRALCGMTIATTQNQWDEYLSEYDLRNTIYPNALMPQNGKRTYTGTYATEGNSILIVCEQGIGDSVMMGRYAQYLKMLEAFEKVYIRCHEEWKGLLRRVYCVDGVFGPDDELPEYDYHVSAMSLMRAEGFPTYTAANAPYLCNSQRSGMVFPKDRFKIGFCWQGNKEHGNDKFRSICIDHFKFAFESLVSERGEQISCYSLQQPKETDWAPAWMQSCQIDTLERLADVIVEMDLVVTVDSAPLHIAGAMGIETLALIPSNPDWRWGTKGFKTDWYPSVRLFRAREPLAWRDLLVQVADLVCWRFDTRNASKQAA